MEIDRFLLLCANRLPGHRGWEKLQLLKTCRDDADFESAVRYYPRRNSGSSSVRRIDIDGIRRDAEAELRRLRHWSIDLLVLGTPDYPPLLSQICDPPLVLYSRGAANSGGREAVAMVGTRRPTAAGCREAYKIALEFALAGYPVVSGLAFGIDRSVHDGALDARGRTWAVLAGGLDIPSPRSHRRLAARILDTGGTLLGEIPPGVFPAKYAFPRRNRILSGLCRSCIIVQAPARSGALITADFALDQNRDVYVASSGLQGPASSGTRNLEAQGALAVRGAADVLADWGRFQDIRTVRRRSEPQVAADLVEMMKDELAGRVFRHTGGCFEYRGA